jgi:hypothetical protein
MDSAKNSGLASGWQVSHQANATKARLSLILNAEVVHV